MLPYTLLLLNGRWFAFIIPLVRALKVISPSGSWHPKVPHASQRILLIHSSKRRLLSHNSERSLLSCNSRRSLLSCSSKWTSSTARVTAMTHLSTLPCVTPMTQTQSRSPFEQLQSFAPMVRSHRLFPRSFMGYCYSWASPRPQSTRSRVLHDQGTWSSVAQWRSSMGRRWSVGTLVPLLEQCVLR
jgi:hypothetical protein